MKRQDKFTPRYYLFSKDYLSSFLRINRKVALFLDLKQKVGIKRIYYGGNHGLDISGSNVSYTHPKAILAKPIMTHIRQQLQKKIRDIDGAWLKDKCLPIYVGDDQTDETAFKSLRKKGITIRVGKSKKTFADYYLKGYWEISRLLQQVQEFVETF